MFDIALLVLVFLLVHEIGSPIFHNDPFFRFYIYKWWFSMF